MTDAAVQNGIERQEQGRDAVALARYSKCISKYTTDMQVAAMIQEAIVNAYSDIDIMCGRFIDIERELQYTIATHRSWKGIIVYTLI